VVQVALNFVLANVVLVAMVIVERRDRAPSPPFLWSLVLIKRR
jgi:hypothetical protein